MSGLSLTPRECPECGERAKQFRLTQSVMIVMCEKCNSDYGLKNGEIIGEHNFDSNRN